MLNIISGNLDEITPGMAKPFIDPFMIKQGSRQWMAVICFCCLTHQNQYMEVVKHLHPEESNYYKMLRFENRRKSYLLGRYSGKLAVADLVGEKRLQNILIKQGIFHQPVVTCSRQSNIQVSITHCDNLGAAVAFPEDIPVGIDIEKAHLDKTDVLEQQMTKAELQLIDPCPYSYHSMLAIFWTVKEALSKVLKTGLMTPFQVFEINDFEIKNRYIFSTFKNFIQYKGMSFYIGDYACSLVYPKNTEIDFGNGYLSKIFYSADLQNEKSLEHLQ